MKNEPAFIIRRRELAFLDSWIAERPNNLLFMYGPKSSGKTTLLMEFVRRNLSSSHWRLVIDVSQLCNAGKTWH